MSRRGGGGGTEDTEETEDTEDSEGSGEGRVDRGDRGSWKTTEADSMTFPEGKAIRYAYDESE